jgi:hypothetical protein
MLVFVSENCAVVVDPTGNSRGVTHIANGCAARPPASGLLSMEGFLE